MTRTRTGDLPHAATVRRSAVDDGLARPKPPQVLRGGSLSR